MLLSQQLVYLGLKLMGTKSFEDGFSRTVKVFGSITVVLSVVVIGLYFFQFNDKLSTNQEDFALFGDFLAGTLTPILTFFTIVLLIMSIKYQVSELKNSTQALNDTKTIHLQSLQLQQENLKIQERNNLIPIAIERLDKMSSRLHQLAEERLIQVSLSKPSHVPEAEKVFNLVNLSNSNGIGIQQLIPDQSYFVSAKHKTNEQTLHTFKIINNMLDVIEALREKKVDYFVSLNYLGYIENYLKMLDDCRIHLDNTVYKEISQLQDKNSSLKDQANWK